MPTVYIVDREGRRRIKPPGYVLQDGETMIVGIDLMDARARGIRSNVTDGFGRSAGHAPGYVFAADTAARGRAPEEAWEERGQLIADAWRNGSPAPAAAPARDSREAAWAERGRILRDAWKGAA